MISSYCKKTNGKYENFLKFLILTDNEKMFLFIGNIIIYLITFSVVMYQ